MDISRWHRTTSLLALSLSIDTALRMDNGRYEPVCDSSCKDKSPRRYRAQRRGANSLAALAIAPSARREPVAAS
jgi:hypothetical protein